MYTRKEEVIKISSPNIWAYGISILFILVGGYFYFKYGDLKAIIFILVGMVILFSRSSSFLYIDLENKDIKFTKRGIFSSRTSRYYLDNISEIVLFRRKEEKEKGGHYLLYSVFLTTKEKEQVSIDGFSNPKFIQINSWSSFYEKNKKIAEKISGVTKIPIVEKEKTDLLF